MSDVPVHATTQRLPAEQVAMEVLARAQDTYADTHDLVESLTRLLRAPADVRTVVLEQATPKERLLGGGKSVGVLNSSPVTIYLGIGGADATPTGRAPACPPNALLVLPVEATNLELGADPDDLAAGDAVVHVLLFPTVQPAFLGVI